MEYYKGEVNGGDFFNEKAMKKYDFYFDLSVYEGNRIERDFCIRSYTFISIYLVIRGCHRHSTQ